MTFPPFHWPCSKLVITGTTALAVTVRVAVPAPVVLLALRVTKIVPGAFRRP